MPADWLPALDDFLCERWLWCLWCGQKGATMELRTAQNGWPLTFTLCRACYDSDPTEQRRQATVEAHARTLQSATQARKD